MFENDDWDFDQDFLNDVDDKVIRYCSQRDNHEKEVKRRKVEINDDPISSCNFDEDPWSEQSNSCGEAIVKRDENNQSRKNLILGIFNKNLPNKGISNNASNNPERSRDNSSSNTRATCSQDCDSDRSIRTNLVLNILQNKNAPDKAAENNRNNVDLKNKGQKVASTRRIDEKQEARRKCDTAKSDFKAASGSSSSSDISAPRFSAKKNSRNQLSADTSKQRSKGCAESRNVSPQNNPRIYKPLQTSPSKKMTLVRKFPGPAGLLPDDVDSNIPCVSYLNSLEEKERASQEAESSDPAGYCSQNTKNLFTEGAWQLMLDDLPDDFLNGHDLATAKRTANLNGLNSMKVEFLAGIVEHIDYSHDNPPIVLKDFTDDIRGIVHKDVPLKYPGLLETNVVILLHDVGLLRISDTFVSNKYQLLIFPSSLLAIYSSKGVIERTRYMDAVFRNTSDASGKGEAKENCAFETMSEAHSSKTRASFDTESSGSSSKGPITFQGSASSKNTNSGNFDPSNEANSSKADIVNVDEPMDFDLNRFDAKNSSSSSKGPINSRRSIDSKSENTRSASSNVPNEAETDDIDQLVNFDSDQVYATNSCSSSSSSKRLINSENSNRKGFDLSARSNERERGNTSVSIDLDSNLFFSISPVQITDSWNSKNFDGSARKNSKHAKRESEKENSWEREMMDARNDGKGKGRDLSAILNKFLPDSYEKRLLFRESKVSPTNARCSSPIAGCSKRIDSDILNDIFSEKLEFDDERSANDTPAKEAKRVEETVSPCSSGNKERDAKKSASSVRSRLLQFKSEDALTPLENLLAKPAATLDSPKKVENLAEKESLPSCSKHGIFNDVENDSDDEILSQMDMDVIFSNYKDDS